MKATIYIMKEQDTGNYTNCIGNYDFQRLQQLAKKIIKLNLNRVFSILPTHTYDKNIRTFQTASNLCTLLDKELEVCNTIDNLPNYVYDNILIVWDSTDIQLILEKYGMITPFVWPEDNFNGCVVINEHGWSFEPDFFSKKNCCFFF
jgi:hypothetical protein